MHMALPLHPHDVPAGYPRQFEREVRLRDGRAALVRPIIPADAPALADAIRTADAETLRRRFLGGPPRLTPTLIEHLSTVDYRRRFALTAVDPLTCRGVAIARYEGTDDGVADVAVAVDPPWRRAGLATALIGMLAEAAVDRGIHAFSSYYLAENRPVAALLGLAGTRGRQTIQLGIAEFLVALDRESVAAAIRDLNSAHPSATPDLPA
jgi:RimJ/RimL family protein N-acetyltransferase